jgi:sec-independent protein translocase protein TatA
MSFGITELIIILVIVLLLFGTKKLRSIGTDLGGAIKGFRSAVSDEQSEPNTQQSDEPSAPGNDAAASDQK